MLQIGVYKCVTIVNPKFGMETVQLLTPDGRYHLDLTSDNVRNIFEVGKMYQIVIQPPTYPLPDERTYTMALSQKLKNACQAKGIDINALEKLLQLVVKTAPEIAAAIEALIGIFGGNTPTPAPALQGLSNQCPCPDPDDECACCNACLHHILLAALACQNHCCHGDQCPCDKCRCETAHHLCKAIECLGCPCCK